MKKFFLVIATVLTYTVSMFAQNPTIPDDPAFRKGVLDNGLTYYIRHNAKPANQAEFFIFHNVGAMQEEDSQQGLAHFLEHMAFNGTKNFPDKNLINWLESIGVKFGENLNAGTAKELTVYMMQNVPLLRESIIDSALLVLHDWSYFITLDDKEIDNERGVIVEELRTRNDANWRVDEKSGHYLYGDTKYAHRNVIGHEQGLRTFAYQELKDFYHRWYRTDQQAIVVVGDFDVDMMERKLKAVMADIPAVENPEPKEYISIPDNVEPIVGVITDPELTSTSVEVTIKRPALPFEYNNTLTVAIMDMLDNFIRTISNERMRDITQKPGAPFISGSISSGGSLTRTTDSSNAYANARDGESLKAFEAIYTEMEKIVRFGFTESEFERAKTQIQRQNQQSYDGRDDRRNSQFVWMAIGNFMINAAMPSAEDDYEITNMLLEMIDLQTLNRFAQERFTPTNQVVLITMPEKEGAVIPTTDQIEAIIAKVRAAELEANVEDVVIEPLIPADTKFKGSKVTKTETDKFGSTVWTLKNGAKVVVHPTDYKADQVLVKISSGGGTSVLGEDEVLTADNLSSYIQQAGVGKFSASELRKQLTGKMASLRPVVDSYSNGFNGSASPKDMEILMQLIYLNFTSPRFDKADFDVMIDRLEANYANVASNPMFILQDELTKTLYNNNPRRELLKPDNIKDIDFGKMQDIYKKLYGNPDDFTYIFTGNIDLETFKPLVEKYIGSLPKSKKKFTWKDDGVRMVQGMVENRFTAPMQMPKATVFYVFNGPMEYSLENDLAMSAFYQSLNMRYQESVREEKGGTYGVSAFGTVDFMPIEEYVLMITFDTDPAMAEELMEIIIHEIELIAENGLNAEDLAKAKEYFAKQHPDDLKQNTYWQGIISGWHNDGYDMNTGYMDIANGLTTDYFKAFARKILDDGNMVLLLMTPKE